MDQTHGDRISVPLPPEIFVEVFHALYTDPTYEQHGHLPNSSHKLLQLMLVCHQWKAFIDSTPRLWTCIRLAPTRRISNANEKDGSYRRWIERQLHATGNLPLHLTIVPDFLLPDDFWPILLPHSERWQSLAILSPPRFQLSQPISHSYFRPLATTPFPRLETLHVMDRQYSPFLIRGFCFIFNVVPNLRNLVCEGALAIFMDENYGDTDDNYHPFTFETISPYTLAQDSLEFLSLKNHPNDARIHVPRHQSPLIMSKLKVLEIWCSERREGIFKFLETPVLEELLVYKPSDYYESSGHPSLPHLRILKWWEATPVAAPHLRDLLSAGGNLEHISFVEWRSSDCRVLLEDVDEVAGQRGETEKVTYNYDLGPLLEHDGNGMPRYCPSIQEVEINQTSFADLEDLINLRSPTLKRIKVRLLNETGQISGINSRLKGMRSMVDLTVKRTVP